MVAPDKAQYGYRVGPNLAIKWGQTGLAKSPVRGVVVAGVERRLIGVRDRVDVHALGAELEAVHAHVSLR